MRLFRGLQRRCAVPPAQQNHMLTAFSCSIAASPRKFSFGGRSRKGECRIGLSLYARSLRELSYVPLPKSSTPSRIRSNAEVYDFGLDQDDMSTLDALDRGKEGAISWNPVDAP